MADLKVKDLMRPLEEYTSVFEDATLKDVFEALESALKGRAKKDPTEARDFAVLVLDRDQQVLGRLGVWDVLQGLEPQSLRRVDALAMVDGYNAWDRPLEHLASKSLNLTARDLVKSLSHKEYISEDAGLNEALRRLIDNRYLSLIVGRQSDTVGILRVVDVFQYVCDQLRGIPE